MKIVLATVKTKIQKLPGSASELLGGYLKRADGYVTCVNQVFADESKLLASINASVGRTRPFLLLADSTGQQISSEELATIFTSAFDAGTQILMFAIGPADGWSAVARQRADRIIAFGKITLPHELAAVVAAEQIYRALTIRAGHPYHSGH